MTLNTGADRSGNTSRRSSLSHTPPSAVPANTRKRASPGLENDFFKSVSSILSSIVVVFLAFATCLLSLGFQQKSTIHNHGFTRLQSADNLDLAFKIAASPYLP